MESLKKDISTKKISNAYLFYGAEKYLIEKYINDIVEALELKDDVMNYVVINGKERPVEDVIDAFQTLPFFAEKRVVIVKDSEYFVKGRKDTEIFIESLKNLPETTVLIFQEDKVEKNLRTYKAFEGISKVCAFEQADEKTLESFVLDYVKGYDIEIDKTTLVFFLQCVSMDMKLIELELQKIISFIGDKKRIEKEDIDNICSKTLDYKVFSLINVMAEKKPLNAVDTFSKLIESKESPLMVLSLIGRHMKILFQVKVLLSEGKIINDISKTLGLPSFAVKDYVKQSKNFSSKELYKSIEECLKVDVGIKRGEFTDYDAVWKLILEFST